VQKNGRWHGEIWLKHSHGESIPVLTSVSEVKNEKDNNLHYVVIFSDITRQKEQEEHLEKLAHYDSLTTLPNRILFFDRFRGALARARRLRKQLAIFYIDLDGFKAVNDTLGHQSGDEVLKNAANVLLHCIREDDTVARLGGDEFVILFNDLENTSHVHMLAERIIKNMSFTLPADKKDLLVTASIGIAIYPGDGDSEETLLRHADNTMYQAKKLGKNNYSIYSQNND
ncbi:MAG: sensor domain-containing diguanylate cyclase, partial [Gammaproteobacteria bacterium]|nr:sensor domain-containing diguanylate cyclase [Gammaproteobacteria bacterium]